MDIIDPIQMMRFGAALIFVLGLMWGLSMLLRHLNEKNGLGGRLGGLAQKRRLRVVESLPIDARRKLMIVRRDDREHLIIVGGNSETLIESNIESSHDEAYERKDNTTKTAA
jgi:flagellar protein FliO/FliZ